MSKWTGFTVANVPYSVDFVDRDAGVKNDDGCQGTCNYEDAEIRIVRRKNRRLLAHTILHEVVHSIAEGYHVSPLINEDGTQDEAAVDQLAHGIDEFLTSVGVRVEDLFDGAYE